MDNNDKKFYYKMGALVGVVIILITAGYISSQLGTENLNNQTAQNLNDINPQPTLKPTSTYTKSTTSTITTTQTPCLTCGQFSTQQTSSHSPTVPTSTRLPVYTPAPTVLPTYIPTIYTPSPTPQPTPEYYMKPAHDIEPCVGLLFEINETLVFILKQNDDNTFYVTNYNEFVDTDINTSAPNVKVQKMTYDEIVSCIQK